MKRKISVNFWFYFHNIIHKTRFQIKFRSNWNLIIYWFYTSFSYSILFKADLLESKFIGLEDIQLSWDNIYVDMVFFSQSYTQTIPKSIKIRISYFDEIAVRRALWYNHSIYFCSLDVCYWCLIVAGVSLVNVQIINHNLVQFGRGDWVSYLSVTISILFICYFCSSHIT